MRRAILIPGRRADPSNLPAGYRNVRELPSGRVNWQVARFVPEITAANRPRTSKFDRATIRNAPPIPTAIPWMSALVFATVILQLNNGQGPDQE